MRIILIFIMLTIGLFGQQLDWSDKTINYPNSFDKWSGFKSFSNFIEDSTATVSSDTSPPDTMTTPIVVDSLNVDSISVAFTPSEIDSSDWKDIVLSFTSRDGLSWSDIVIPRATALSDSDTLVFLSNFRYDTGSDNSDIVSVVATVRDSSNNSLSMAAVESPEFIINVPSPIIDSLQWRPSSYPEYVDYRFVQSSVFVNTGIASQGEAYFQIAYLNNGTRTPIAAYQSFNNQQFSPSSDTVSTFLIDVLEYENYTVGDTFTVYYRYLAYGSSPNQNTIYQTNGSALSQYLITTNDSLFYPDTVVSDTVPPETPGSFVATIDTPYNFIIDGTGILGGDSISGYKVYTKKNAVDGYELQYDIPFVDFPDTTLSLSGLFSVYDSLFVKISAYDSIPNIDPTGITDNYVQAMDNFYATVNEDSVGNIKFIMRSDSSGANIFTEYIAIGIGTDAVIDTTGDPDSTRIKIPQFYGNYGYFMAIVEQIRQTGSYRADTSAYGWWSPPDSMSSFVASESATADSDSVRLVMSGFPQIAIDSIRYYWHASEYSLTNHWFTSPDSVNDTTVVFPQDAGSAYYITASIYYNGVNSGQVGWSLYNRDTVNVPTMTGGGGGSALWANDFEGSGNTLTLGGAGADTNYTTVAPQGTYSIRLDNSGAGSPTATSAYWDTTSMTTMYARFIIHYPGGTPASNTNQINFLGNETGNPISLVSFNWRSGGFFRYTDGIAYNVDTGAPGISADTDYYIWLEYTPGTGANAVFTLYYATTGTKPETAVGSITNSTLTRRPRWLQIVHGSADDVVIDNIEVSTSVQGDF